MSHASQPMWDSLVLHGVRFHRSFAEYEDWHEYLLWLGGLAQRLRIECWPSSCPVDGDYLPAVVESKLRLIFHSELAECGL